MTERIKVKLCGGVMPAKATPHDAAYDLYVADDVVLHSRRQVIDLGFMLELPRGYAATIQPRSGFSSKGIECEYWQTVVCMDSDGHEDVLVDDRYRLDADVVRGLVDSGYRGHVGVIIHTHRRVSDSERFVIRKGTRIAQMQIVRVPDTELVEADALDMSDDRGGGFGHSGV